MKPPTNPPEKPALDEAAFQKLLSAAYVLQQHKERLLLGGENESIEDRTLTHLLEIQEEVRARRLDVRAAAALLVRRVRGITSASGATVGMLEDDQMDYYAASGSAAAEAGSRTPFDMSLAAECLRTGQILQSQDAEKDQRLPFQLCHRLKVGALLAAPIVYEGQVIGAFELHFAEPNSFREHDVRICQLLAALMAEIIARDKLEGTAASLAPPEMTEPEPVDESVAPAVPGDRASLLAALNRIKPQLERLVSSAAAPAPAPTPQPLPPPALAEEPVRSAPVLSASLSSPAFCQGCGNVLDADQLFCGVCGTARAEENRDEGAPQNTWASLWEMQKEAERSSATTYGGNPAAARPDPDTLDILPSELEDLVAEVAQHPSAGPPPKASSVLRGAEETAAAWGRNAPQSSRAQDSEASFPAPVREPASAAPSAQDYGLPSLAPGSAAQRQSGAHRATELAPGQAEPEAQTALANADVPAEPPHASGGWLRQQWGAQRANIYVAAAALLLAAVLAGWLTPSRPSAPAVSASAGTLQRRKAPAKPELSLFDQLLVNLGIADAPSPPAELGNPDTRVWIDTHTALYYCPGSDLFGKTPGGRFTTQGDAEQDAFQPAMRKPCD